MNNIVDLDINLMIISLILHDRLPIFENGLSEPSTLFGNKFAGKLVLDVTQ